MCNNRVSSMVRKRVLIGIVSFVVVVIVVMVWCFVYSIERAVGAHRAFPSPADLSAHCCDEIGLSRVERVGERVFVAIGYDFANTILVYTDVGNVVIDVGMSSTRAMEARAALEREAPGDIVAIV